MPTTWETDTKSGTSGEGWQYNEANFTYNIDQDTISGAGSVQYDFVGLSQTFTNVPKT